MKAAVYMGNRTVEVRESSIPEIKPFEVLVKVKACGVCGTDVHIYEGAEGAAQCTPPTILGHEFSGIIEKVGIEVGGMTAGQRVCVDPNDMCGKCYYCRNGMAHFCENMTGIGTTTNGGFSQYCAVNAKQIYSLPDEITFAEGAMVEPVACCLHGIDMCAIHPGDTVMVIGAGTIGLIMLQLVRMSGATSIVVLETVAEKREIAKKLGTDIVIDPRSQDVEALLQSAGIGRIATTIECVGSRQTMLDAIHYAGKNSVAMLFGLTSPDTEILIRPFDIFKKEVSIKASFINPYTHSRAVEILKSGRIDINALISHTISLDDLSQVLADPTTRRNGKVIVDPWA